MYYLSVPAIVLLSWLVVGGTFALREDLLALKKKPIVVYIHLKKSWPDANKHHDLSFTIIERIVHVVLDKSYPTLTESELILMFLYFE